MSKKEEKKIKVNMHRVMMNNAGTDEEIYAGVKRDIERLKEMRCCICGEPYDELYNNHNPYPVRPECRDFWSKDGRCCSKCNDTYVASFRRIRFTKDSLYKQMAEMLADCKNLDEIHDLAEANDFQILDFTPDYENAVNFSELAEETGENPLELMMKHFKENAKPLKVVPRPTKK